MVGAEGGFLNLQTNGLEAVEETVGLSNGAQGVDFCAGSESWVELEREGLDVFVVGEDSGGSAGTDRLRFAIGASGEAEVIFEVWFDDEAEIGFEAEVLEAVIHEEDVVGELLGRQLSCGNAIMSNDEGKIGQKFAEHGGFITPFVDIEEAIWGEGCAVVFGGTVSRSTENYWVVSLGEGLGEVEGERGFSGSASREVSDDNCGNGWDVRFFESEFVDREVCAPAELVEEAKGAEDIGDVALFFPGTFDCGFHGDWGNCGRDGRTACGG